MPESCPGPATLASASGKLAPHRIAPGSITQIARIRSSWKLNVSDVEIDGLIGQYGSDTLVAYAAQARHTHNPSWHQPSAILGFDRLRAIADPRLLPMPRPTRNTARISEKVYVVAPKSSDSIRVHTTSDPSAVRPDSAMAM